MHCVLGIYLVAAALAVPLSASAQSTATVRGTVTDELGGVMPGVDVQLIRTLTGLSRRTVTGPDGAFEWANLPPDRYELRAEISGFEPHLAPVTVRTSVPLTLTIVLRVATQSTTVLVTPAPQLVDPTITGTRTQVSFVGIDQLPAPVGSRDRAARNVPLLEPPGDGVHLA